MTFHIERYNDLQEPNTQISEEEYEDLKSAKSTCIFALELEEKFALLMDNYCEFETELLKLAETSRIWVNRDHGDSMNERLLLDRRIVNLLTASRLYLDQTDHGISSLFGKPSDELTAVKTFKNVLYDDHWGYRFLEAMRNHVQHAGLPVHIISYNSRISKDSIPNYTQYTIIPQVSTKKLGENVKFKKTILSELKEKGEKVDLRPGIREYINCFSKLHEHIRQKIAEKLEADRNLYENAIMANSNTEGDTDSYIYYVKKGEDEVTIEQVALVEDFLGHLDYLYNCNEINPNMTDTFSANMNQ